MTNSLDKAQTTVETEIKFSSSKIRGLDSIRFVCALWVVLGHLGFFPEVRMLDRDSFWGMAVRGILGNLFTGSPAVIVFFVISGFCIHYPFREPGRLPGWRFLVRRYLRIGIPVAGAMTFIHFFVPDNPAFNLAATSGTVVWSLLAEVIYYTLYPFLRAVAGGQGWWRLLAGAGGLSLVIFICHPSAKYLPSVGPWLTWIAGLPYWLLGCLLAEKAGNDKKPAVTPRKIWIWRLGIWAGASASSVLMFHAAIGFPWTMMIFGPAVFGWLRREIAFYRTRRPWALLEWAGSGVIRFTRCTWCCRRSSAHSSRRASIQPAGGHCCWFSCWEVVTCSTCLLKSHRIGWEGKSGFVRV